KAITGLRIEALSDASLPSNGPGLPPNGNFVLSETKVKWASTATPKKSTPVKIVAGAADFLQGGFSAAATFDGQNAGTSGWA
ncbi:MAG: hypothetical protein AAFP90_06595, partial [Planctomycetota bacterium]